MAISASLVKQLRAKTGAGMMECKKALEEAGGDMDKAVEILRKRGIEAAEGKFGREIKEGRIGCYIHFGGRLGVMVEMGCETDFVANTEDFQQLMKDVCMHVAASNPRWIRREDVPEEVLTKEKEIYAEQFKDKPPQVVDKIVQGKIESFFKENCLLEQPFVKDQDVTVGELIREYIAKFGENVEVRRFVRFAVGEET